MNARSFALGAAGVVVFAAVVASAPRRRPNATRRARPRRPAHSYTKDVAPIMQRSCQTCHRPGTNAPMSLLTYEDARPWARAIKTKVTQRLMPPWHIERNVGIQQFKDDPSLSDDEIATIAAWVDAGAPQGNADRHAARRRRSPTTRRGTSAAGSDRRDSRSRTSCPRPAATCGSTTSPIRA